MKLKNTEDVYPMSPVQQGMLFHTLCAPEGGVYFTQLLCGLEGHLDEAAFSRAWQQVLDRHPILRTAFIWEGLAEPLQVVRRHVELPWVYEDWSALAAGARQAKLDQYLLAERRQGFDLSKAPLMRLTLLRWTEAQSQLIWSSHHMLLDGWSMPLLLQEVFTLYEAACRGQVIELPRPRPYRDYIAWLHQQETVQAEAFWRKRLHGVTAPTELPVRETGAAVDGPTAPGPSALPSTVSTALTAATTAVLQTLARQHYLTLNAILQGAWALLLSRYNGVNDVVFGTTLSGRPASLRGADSMIGLFINTLPVRLQVPPDAFVFQWLQNVQRRHAELQQYEHSPLTQVHAWSEIPRDTPLFDSLFVFENYYSDAHSQPQDAGLKLCSMRNFERTHYPLTVAAAVMGPQLHLTFQYDETRFDPATIARMAGHLRQILEDLAAHPSKRVAELSLMTGAERQQILDAFNPAPATAPGCSDVLQHFLAQVAQTPEAIALIAGDQRLCYQELNSQANQLAHSLRRLGVGPEVLVGVCLERSAALVISLLAILKAGGVYFPIDPQNPAYRIRLLLNDSHAPLLLTHGQVAAALEATPRSPNGGSPRIHPDEQTEPGADSPLAPACRFLLWEAVTTGMAQESVTDPDVSTTPADAAYMLYTSGSTGKPKGVIITRESLAQHILNVRNHYHLRPGDRMLQFAAPAYDGSIEQILAPLLGGASLTMLEPGLWRVEDLHQKIVDQGLTVINLPPAYWHQLVQLWSRLPARALPTRLRLIIAGGDVLLPESIRLWRQTPLHSTVRLLNAYGPTEATVTATTFDITCAFGDPALARRVPIGRAYPHRRIYILDQHGCLAPVGIWGELHLGGMGLARGYFRHSDLTAEKFVPDPFSHRPGARLYKTGDLARYLEDGNIEFLGRKDHQVKLRGFRIELGEIETTLGLHPDIRQAVVASLDQGEKKHLVAYLVPQGTLAPQASELREFLKQRLPDYMVPSVFIRLAELPMAPGGKVDRRALPVPGCEDLTPSDVCVAPRNDLEQQLVEIWEEVLGVRPIGVTDNFFERGGHSLLATQLFSRLREAFQVDFPLPVLFETPTVEGLAKVVMSAIIEQADEAALDTALKELNLTP